MEQPYDAYAGVIPHLRLHGGTKKKIPPTRRCPRDHGTRGGRAGLYDPKKVELRKLLDSVLEKKRRSYRAGPAVLRHRKARRTAIFFTPTSRSGLAKPPKRAPKTNVQGRYLTPVRAGWRVLAREDYHQDFYVKNPVRYQVLPNRLRPDARLKHSGERAALTRVTDMRRFETVTILAPSSRPSPPTSRRPGRLQRLVGGPGLVEAVKREGGGWIAERASRMGDLVGRERSKTLATQANVTPEAGEPRPLRQSP